MKTGIYFILFIAALSCFAVQPLYANAPENLPSEETNELIEESSELSAEEIEYINWAQNFQASLNFQSGNIELPGKIATLDVPETFVFLNAADAQRVLEEAWGNPPGQEVLGMLVPAGVSVLDPDSWAVTLEYVEDGYISDEDAHQIDYNDLLKDMQSGTRAESKERVKLGYESIELLGWAKQPYYDGTTKKLYWAKEIKFGEMEENTLNYNIRVLGRKGYLVLNFIASMSQLETIDSAMPEVLAMAEFNQGMRYADFQPGVDEVAAYGIGALVAGKVAAKTGLLAALLLLLKKFGVFIVIGLGAAGRFLFGKKDKSPTP